MSDWIRLKRGNDWGCDYFAIEPLRNGFASGERGIKCHDGEVASFRFPDGAIVEVAIRIVAVPFTVGDHGHNYEGVAKIPHIAVQIHGLESLVRIDAVEVDRDWAIAHGAQ